MAEKDETRRAKVRRFTAACRGEFLAHLRHSGNQTAAAKATGLARTAPEQRRARDAEFELQCLAAAAVARGDAREHPLKRSGRWSSLPKAGAGTRRGG